MRLPAVNIPASLRERIIIDARSAVAAYPPGPDAVARLSVIDLSDGTGGALSWDFKFTMLSHVRPRANRFPLPDGDRALVFGAPV